MKFDFGQADDLLQFLQTVIGDMETNIGHLHKLPKELESVFTGATADGHNVVAEHINRRLTSYSSDVQQLKTNAATAAGSGGFIYTSDRQGRALFEGLM